MPKPAGWYRPHPDVDAVWWWSGSKWLHDADYKALSGAQATSPAPTGAHINLTGPIERIQPSTPRP